MVCDVNCQASHLGWEICDQLTSLRIDHRRVRCTVAWAVADVASPATAFAWTGLTCM